MKPTLNRFDEIQHLPLKVYNRLVLMHNLLEDFGKETATDYINLFSEAEKKQIYVMGAYVKREGVDNVRKEVTKNLKVDYVPAE